MRASQIFGLAGLCLCASASESAVAESPVERPVPYKQGETNLEGYLVTPQKHAGKMPAVIVVHDWMGLGDYVKTRERMIAELGYLAFGADVYGKGVRPTNGNEAAKMAGSYKNNLPLLRARIRAAYDTVAGLPEVDPARIVVMGYCFGGGVALELARSGVPLVGTATFHGNLASSQPGDAKNIKGSVIVFHGANDPFVKPAEVAAFEDEMRKHPIDWQLILFSGAVHSFSNPGAGNNVASGNAYNETADRRSWNYFKTFLQEVFRKKE